MTVITIPIDAIIKSAGNQKITDSQYRHFTYTQTVTVEDGLLVYNLMTRELVLLREKEIAAYNSCDFSVPAIKELAGRWFFVPKKHDDYKFHLQTDALFRTICDNASSKTITHFLIYTTTDCNARCFYCFELACKRIHMSEQTALDVVEYIAKESKGNAVKISWFGGEPLYNSSVIDVITQGLNDKNISYTSSMVSNAYLFDEQLVSKAKKSWNLNKIQVTLDGTEEIYNKTKAFIYEDDLSPFRRVINNIELLLKSDIYVTIRLNLGIHNYQNLKDLLLYLFEKFDSYPKLMIYTALLYDNGSTAETRRSPEEKRILWEKIFEFKKLIAEHKHANTSGIWKYRTSKHCLADNNESVTITPDGKLGKCEYFTDDSYFGSIYSDKIDYLQINRFKEVANLGERCHLCPLQPKCYPLKACPQCPQDCDEFDRFLKIDDLKRQIVNTYEFFKRKKLHQ